MRLILTRHAKSSWDEPYLGDHDRPLSKRGRKSSDAIGKWLVENSHIPKTVLCSTSARTTETWDRIQKFMPHPCDVRYESDLYHGSIHSILDVLAQATESPVLVLGHNPGIGVFAESILRVLPHHHAFMLYPTAATLVCDVPVENWTEVRMNTAQFIDFVIPRELI